MIHPNSEIFRITCPHCGDANAIRGPITGDGASIRCPGMDCGVYRVSGSTYAVMTKTLNAPVKTCIQFDVHGVRWLKA